MPRESVEKSFARQVREKHPVIWYLLGDVLVCNKETGAVDKFLVVRIFANDDVPILTGAEVGGEVRGKGRKTCPEVDIVFLHSNRQEAFNDHVSKPVHSITAKVAVSCPPLRLGRAFNIDLL